MIVAVICGVVAVTICVSTDPLMRWTQETAACWGADRVARDTDAGPTLGAQPHGRGAGTVATSTFALSCTYGSRIRHVENDEAVVKGMGIGFALGAVPALALIGIRAAARTLRRAG